ERRIIVLDGQEAARFAGGNRLTRLGPRKKLVDVGTGTFDCLGQEAVGNERPAAAAQARALSIVRNHGLAVEPFQQLYRGAADGRLVVIRERVRKQENATRKLPRRPTCC